ncbi:hypothetical protein AB0K43_07650 [Kitasatospora sp. NPDC049258]|uniref:hypothetical protein n=1 Tax=Kitasatospora sp. NPDC049258 TaxID=3155394 RepID=UPI003438B583
MYVVTDAAPGAGPRALGVLLRHGPGRPVDLRPCFGTWLPTGSGGTVIGDAAADSPARLGSAAARPEPGALAAGRQLHGEGAEGPGALVVLAFGAGGECYACLDAEDTEVGFLIVFETDDRSSGTPG